MFVFSACDLLGLRHRHVQVVQFQPGADATADARFATLLEQRSGGAVPAEAVAVVPPIAHASVLTGRSMEGQRA